MTEQEMEAFLTDAISCYTDSEVLTFEEAGLLTRNRGLVVRTPDGSEFQLTIVKSE